MKTVLGVERWTISPETKEEFIIFVDYMERLPHVEATWNKFKGLVEPILSNVQTQFGITGYRLILDSTTTTEDLIDQNVLYAKIMIKPARAIEYIAIDFAILNTGASFDD